VSEGREDAHVSTGREDIEIAIVGMSCRFPGAPGVEAFWQNLRDGVESIRFFSEDELAEAGVSRAALQDPDYVRAAPVLDDVDLFDARFFGFTAREAQVLDPQQRLFLEVAWEALERAGCDPARFPGSIGVFGGASASSYAIRVMASPEIGHSISPYQALLSNEKDFLAARVAYKLDLRGPAVVVQAACATSLVAVHVACQSLLAGECDMALAGGSSVSVPQGTGYRYEPDGILSRDGHCRAFDAAASGALRGSGVGVVVLKRLADALRDGDPIEAVIMGSATNNDGARKVGFTAPGVDGQAEVVRAAQAVAGVSPHEVTYVEAHGTATALGDPIEVAALTEVFRAGKGARGSCGLGSVKTNFGHLDAAAGVAGLIKAALMLKHGELVPSLHFHAPNPRIDFEDSPFRIVTRNAPWRAEGPRRAGVSSFGIGGSNAHIVLGEPPVPRPDGGEGGADVLVVSALTGSALERATDALVAHVERQPGLSLADVAFTLRAGRRAFPHRRAVACRDLAEGARLLASRDPRQVFHAVADAGRPVAFLFSGQGAQHADMARGLYDAEPAFRAEVDACCEQLRPRLGLDLRELLFPAGGDAADAGRRLAETRFTQPALFTIEHALARLWMDWGVRPTAMIGHSVGELVAACLAGVLERDTALALVAERARCMQECPPGAMTAVALPEDELRALLPPGLDLCVVNGPEACVVGGPFEEIEGLEARLGERGVAHGRVPTSHAFHSRLMEPALAPFAAGLAGIELRPPRVPFVSNLTGTWITDAQATDPAYWVRQLRETVRFSEGLATLAADPRRALLEIGPGHTLVALARRQRPGVLAFASLPHPRQADKADLFLLQTAARLWAHGVPVDLASRDRRSARRRLLLPTYPFERARYWLDGGTRSAPAAVPPVAASAKLPVERWLYTPSWRRAEIGAAEGAGAASWCVLVPEEGELASALVEGLRASGADPIVVKPGAGFAAPGPRAFTIDPARAEDYDRLLDRLSSEDAMPDHFVHAWSVGAEDPLARGFQSVVLLGRSLGGRQGRETSLDVVTSRALDVLGTEPLLPLAATVLGPCRVIPQEYPLLRCRAIDLDEPSSPAHASWLAASLVAELATRPGGATVAYRGRSRWVQWFEPVEPAPGPEAAPLRPRGVYLVTGGMGKVGLALAAYLARRVQARLVLTARTPLPDRGEWARRATGDDDVARRVRAVQELEAAGAEVLALRADAGDLEEMRAALQAARARFGRIDGVVHAAAELGPGAFRPLAATGREDAERQLRPKLGGALVLEKLLADEPPDFVLFTSSVSTVLGGLGLAAYAAANHALDAFARRRPATPGRGWVSVCWDGWDLEAHASGPGARLAATSISAEEGGEAFARALARTGVPQLVVSTTPLEARLEQWTRTDAPQAPPARPSGAEAARDARPEIGAVYVAPEDPVDQRLAAIWADMLGIDRVGADDSFFELGGSSLLAVHMMGRVRREYPVELSVTTLFEAPTVRTLGQVIRTRRAGPAGGPPPSAAPPTNDRRTLDAARR
jgi:acyl transferase domain-containing protein